jgi:Fibronectin type III domain/Dockerin type I domain
MVINFILASMLFSVSIALAEQDSQGSLAGVSDYAPGQVLLRWTAPGDNGYTGQAAGYEMRYQPYSRGKIDTDLEWYLAAPVPGLPQPSPAGAVDSIVVGGLTYGATYFFCVRAYDKSGNYSQLSNSPFLTAGDTLPCAYNPGNANGDGAVNIMDVSFLLSFLYRGGLAPYRFELGDIDGSGSVDVRDVSYLIRFIYKEGPEPPCLSY